MQEELRRKEANKKWRDNGFERNVCGRMQEELRRKEAKKKWRDNGPQEIGRAYASERSLSDDRQEDWPPAPR